MLVLLNHLDVNRDLLFLLCVCLHSLFPWFVHSLVYSLVLFSLLQLWKTGGQCLVGRCARLRAQLLDAICLKGYERRRRLDKIDDRDESNEGKSRMEGCAKDEGAASISSSSLSVSFNHVRVYAHVSVRVCLCVSVCVLSVTKLPFRSLLPPWYWPPA